MTLAEQYPEAYEIVSETNPDAPWTLLVVTAPDKLSANVVCALQDAAEAGNQIRIIAAEAEHLIEPVIAALRIVRACRGLPTIH